MKLKELIKQLQEFSPKYDDCNVLIDTDAAEFMVHMVEPTRVNLLGKELIGKDVITIHLDNEVKRHRANCEHCDK